MGIKNYVNEFQDYFFIKRSLLERVDINTLSPSSLEGCYKQTEQILKEFETNLSFMDLESKQVLIEVEDAINSLNNKLDKINSYALALKTINSSERDIKSIIDVHPYSFNKQIDNWENETSSYIIKPESSYKTVQPYSTAIEGNSGLYKYLLDSEYASRYVVINKNNNLIVNKILCYNSSMEKLSDVNIEPSRGSSLVAIDNKTRYVTILTSNTREDDIVSITPLSYYHDKCNIVDLEEVTYKKGNSLLFKSNTDIPYGCFIQIKLDVLFKDINGVVTNSCVKWFSINNDGLIIMKKKYITTEVPYKVWRENVFIDVKTISKLKDDDYVLCKALDNELIITNTESSFIINENKSKTITIKPTLYLYSLYNRTQTPRISNLIGIIKNVS